MPYLLPCRCGSTTAVQKSQAGSRIECMQCKQVLEIPTIRGLSELEFEDELPQTDNRKRVSRLPWTPLRGGITATCFVITLFGLGRAALYGAYRLSHLTPYSVEQMLRETEIRSRALSPVETWDSWRYLQETGLGSKRPPEVFVVQHLLEQRDTEMSRWAGAGAIGLLGLIAAALWPSRRKPLED